MRVGVDLGGTKIEALVLSDSGEELARGRAATPKGDYEGTLDALRRLVQSLESRAGGKAPHIGIGMPGSLAPDSGLVQNSNSTCLIGRPLDEDLRKALNRPVRLANDADCFALSEATDGAASGAPIVFGAILGTGVGGGIVVNGKTLDGPNRIAGEWGHNPLPWPKDHERPGPECYCGKRGCIEQFLSGPGLERDHGGGLQGDEIDSQARMGDAAAQSALDRYAHRLARGLASIINVLDPHVIVLGGGVSNIDFLYERVPSLWGDFVFTGIPRTRLLKARFGDSSGVRGAAWL
ncbi:MAG: transcriptional regulator [Elusimicrobia bacterium CG1_02_63_36]|nr:MAG: transcriptional regulator [Elusimicrobia bacterium CG1_02_63_36]PIP82977.1 MAG: transcriptional regulator [Elusimicrobia bacterium CG22_combo_CG10-13_8_21_14_all_63_91]PJA17471.1 MAG: transcriptional regulator [Elusimicrobia bacterium CG_4_10_14_0_2_um_filter_63_34]PJB25457.1 MAG: transcriptional regulator [Elusimicrobia bacterium CG_4_9_14_3_um_filter_62_55]